MWKIFTSASPTYKQCFFLYSCMNQQGAKQKQNLWKRKLVLPHNFALRKSYKLMDFASKKLVRNIVGGATYLARAVRFSLLVSTCVFFLLRDAADAWTGLYIETAAVSVYPWLSVQPLLQCKHQHAWNKRRIVDIDTE